MILIIDFGSQTTHLIQRRLKDFGVNCEIINPKDALKKISALNPKGIILSGGPSSVYIKGAPNISTKIFDLQIPILGICYGFQLTSKLLNGNVISGKKEYGPAKITITNLNSSISKGLKNSSVVWMSHGDEVKKLPKGFSVIGSTENVPFAFVADFNRNIFGVQFHPEVEHTKEGIKILENFVRRCNVEVTKKKISVKKLISQIKEIVGTEYVIGGISGGVDSTVAGVLTARAIGKFFIPVYVENGLMREDTEKFIQNIFTEFKLKPIVINCQNEMLARLKGISDPEEKRKVIGNFYIEIFEKEVERLKKHNKHIKFLMQGTIYSDVIESQGTKHSAKIKSHHNVGGLPAMMKLKLLEPLRFYYKDEVRLIGKKLKLADEFVHKQTFPGPGYAIRIRGEVTLERLTQEKLADKIILEELNKANLLKKVFISFPVLTGAQSTAVKGDDRFFGEVIALRVVESKDVMTADWSRLSYDVLQKISSRIVNEVTGISRVVYDITTKPPGTMEWE